MTRRMNLTLLAKGILTIAGLYWFLMISSIVGLTDFLDGRIMQSGAAILTGVMLLLPAAALVLLMLSRGDDDQTQIG